MLSGHAGTENAIIPVHPLNFNYLQRYHHVSCELPSSQVWTHHALPSDSSGIKVSTPRGFTLPDYPSTSMLMSGIPEATSDVTNVSANAGVGVGGGGSSLNSCSSSSTVSSSVSFQNIPAGATSSSSTTHVNGHYSQQQHNNNYHHQSKDTTYTKIFVGGLPYHTTDKSLRKFFETFGEIEEAVVITDRQTGKSRGYGFVTMADREAAERAVKDANPIIDGRKANVNLAYLGAKPRSNNTSNGLHFQNRPGPYQPILPGHLGLHPNPFMYHHVSPSTAYVGPSLLIPPTTHFLDFSSSFPMAPPPPPPATASYLNHHSFSPFQGAGHGPSNMGIAAAGGPHATYTGTFIPDGRMQ